VVIPFQARKRPIVVLDAHAMHTQAELGEPALEERIRRRADEILLVRGNISEWVLRNPQFKGAQKPFSIVDPILQPGVFKGLPLSGARCDRQASPVGLAERLKHLGCLPVRDKATRGWKGVGLKTS
jgi:hypothetical protein